MPVIDVYLTFEVETREQYEDVLEAVSSARPDTTTVWGVPDTWREAYSVPAQG